VPFTWRHPERADDPSAAELAAGLAAPSLPLVRLPGGRQLRAPTTGQVSRALGIGREMEPREEVDLVVVGAGPAGLGAAAYGASEGFGTLIIDSTALGGQAGASRRIENYLGFLAGISGSELTSRAVTQARKFGARLATPYRALSLESGNGRHILRLEDDREIAALGVVPATGAQYRRLPVEALSKYGGVSVFYAAGPPEAQLCGAERVAVVGGGNSAGQAALWLARGGALVTLPYRRADLRETMSDYLIHELERERSRLSPSTRADRDTSARSDGKPPRRRGSGHGGRRGARTPRRTHDTRRRTPRSLPGRRSDRFRSGGSGRGRRRRRCRRSRD
jgi:thioredoxin reductase (NADPH)